MTRRPISHSRALIAQRFRALRIAAGLTPAAVYTSLDIPRTTLQSIESGAHLPNVIVCGILCAFYDAPVDFILTGTGLNRRLELPRGAAIMLKEIMTPLDLQEPKPGGKAGFLTLKVAALPPAEFDLKRVLLRKPASEVAQAKQAIKHATPVQRAVEHARVGGFLKIKIEESKKLLDKPKPISKATRSKRAKANLKNSGLLDI